jgi:superfamily I DNA/RNA helicase
VQFKESDYELVEKILLKDGHFNSKQREFIELEKSMTIVAGPGAGKTTALAAKIALLLKNLKNVNSMDGMCIITHTNVAVNEINNVLIQARIGSIDHPHFIGTIHEFFNRYCVIPFFKYKFKHNGLIFDNEHKSDLIFYKSYLGRKNSWMNKPRFKGVRDAVAERTYKSELLYNKENNTLDLINSSNWDWEKFNRYKDQMLKAKIARKKQGFLTHEDTFLFSSIFLQESRFKEMLRKRFKYVFLDEFQDTSPDGILLLEELFGTKSNIFQKIGDPYQTIIYNQPMPKIDEKQVFRLNITNRFGKEIANHLNILIPDANIQTNPDKKSFPPIILLYKNENEIYSSYKKIIREYEEMSQSFKKSNKEDKVLVLRKEWTSLVKNGEEYKEKKQKKLKSINETIKSIIVDFITKKVVADSETLSDAKLWVSKHNKIDQLNSILIKVLRSEGLTSSVKYKLKDFINILLEEKGVKKININNSIFDKLETSLSLPDVMIDEEDSDDIFTIHSVKGETLRSVLVVDFDKKPLTKILLHRYGISDDHSYSYTENNLLYVAMSRVTHLFIFALHQDNWTHEVREKLQTNWIIKHASLEEVNI